MDSKIQYYVINMDKDRQRLETFSSNMKKQNLEFSRHTGPLVETKQITFNNRKYRVYARGYVGVALAHLTLWEKISKIEKEIFVNVFEDDEVIKENYEENIMKELSKINGPFDFFNLSVIRPMGFEAHPGILKINDKNIGSNDPNIWLSNYIITPCGARKILSFFRNEVKNINKNFDRIIVKILHKHCNEIQSYVLEAREKYSLHYEKESSKKDINQHNILFRIIKLIRGK